MPEAVPLSHVLALASAPLILLLATLAGLWLGFRICTRDASLLARFAGDANEARMLAEKALGSQAALREEWEATSDAIERKRASTAAAASRAKRDAAPAAPGTAEEATPPAPLSARDRRRLIGRQIALAGAGGPR